MSSSRVPDSRMLYTLPVIGASIVAVFQNALASRLQSIIRNLFQIIFDSTFNVIFRIFTGTTEYILLFPPPGEIDELGDLYWTIFELFWVVLALVGSVFFLMAMLFPDSDKADVERFFKRSFIGVVLILIIGPLGNGFDIFVQSSNLVIAELYPDSFSIEAQVNSAQAVAEDTGAIISMAVFAFVFSWKILITYGMFLIMLGMRMIIVYTVYAIFPLLIACWIADIGPLKYGKFVADKAFKIVIMLMLLGVLIALILGVGAAMAGDGVEPGTISDGEDRYIEQSWRDSADLDERTTGGIFEEEDVDVETSEAESGELSGHNERNSVVTGLKHIYMSFGSIWLCIALVGMFLGSTTSTGLTAQMARAQGWQQSYRRHKAKKQQNSDSSVEMDDDEFDDEIDADADEIDSGVETDEAEPPDNPTEVPLREKAKSTVDRATGGRASSVADSYRETKDKATDMDTWNDAADDVKDSLGGKTGMAAGAAVKGAGYATQIGAKAGNLGKRGGKAWYSVFKQPDAGSSISEAGRIARASPIGKPDSPKGGSGGATDQDGVVSDSDAADVSPEDLRDVSTDELDNNPEDFHNTRFNHGEDVTVKKTQKKGDLQRTTLETEGGEEIYHFGTDINDGGEALEKGETYQVDNARLRKYTGGAGWAHDEVPDGEDYWQLQTDKHSVLNKKSGQQSKS